jgi:hypothetical protein
VYGLVTHEVLAMLLKTGEDVGSTILRKVGIHKITRQDNSEDQQGHVYGLGSSNLPLSVQVGPLGLGHESTALQVSSQLSKSMAANDHFQVPSCSSKYLGPDLLLV